MDIKNIKLEIKENGFNPDDFVIIIDGNGYSFYPKFNLDIREAFEKEDKTVKAAAEHNSAMGTLEILQLSEKNIKDIQLEISQSDLEMLMMITSLNNEVKELKNIITEIKGGDK